MITRINNKLEMNKYLYEEQTVLCFMTLRSYENVC